MWDDHAITRGTKTHNTVVAWAIAISAEVDMQGPLVNLTFPVTTKRERQKNL